MSSIFSTAPGTVAQFDMGSVVPGKIASDDLDLPGGGSGIGIILTNTVYDQATHQQFSQSLDDAVYIYVFGDQMGKIDLSGIAFWETCTGEHGISTIMDSYEKNRASKRETSVTVVLGPKTIIGFLTKLKISAVGSGDDPANMMNQFAMEISALPNKG